MIYPSAGKALFLLLDTCELCWEHSLVQACTNICFHFSGYIPGDKMLYHMVTTFTFLKKHQTIFQMAVAFPCLSQSVMSLSFLYCSKLLIICLWTSVILMSTRWHITTEIQIIDILPIFFFKFRWYVLLLLVIFKLRKFQGIGCMAIDNTIHTSVFY